MDAINDVFGLVKSLLGLASTGYVGMIVAGVILLLGVVFLFIFKSRIIDFFKKQSTEEAVKQQAKNKQENQEIDVELEEIEKKVAEAKKRSPKKKRKK